MIFKLLTEHHLAFLSLKVGCRGSSKSTHVKMPHCWKFHVMAHMLKLEECIGKNNVKQCIFSSCLYSTQLDLTS